MQLGLPTATTGTQEETETGTERVTRRKFLHLAGAGAVGWAALSHPSLVKPAKLPNPVGYSNISWSRDDFDQAMDEISLLGFQGMQLLGWVQQAYQGEQTTNLRRRLGKLKLYPAALSCSGVALRPDSPETFTAQFQGYAAFLRNLGGRVLQLIDGGQAQATYSAYEIKSMGARMNDLGRLANDSGMTVGYHPHFRTTGETREGLERVLDASDPRYVGLVADVAHLTLGGADPAEVIRTYHQRLVLVHLKVVRRDAYELAQQNRPEARKLKARFCEIGRGMVDFPAVVASLREVQYRGWVIVELDSYVPPAGGPAESARINKAALKSLGFKA